MISFIGRARCRKRNDHIITAKCEEISQMLVARRANATDSFLELDLIYPSRFPTVYSDRTPGLTDGRTDAEGSGIIVQNLQIDATTIRVEGLKPAFGDPQIKWLRYWSGFKLQRLLGNFS